jgi:hypothetical protein
VSACRSVRVFPAASVSRAGGLSTPNSTPWPRSPSSRREISGSRSWKWPRVGLVQRDAVLETPHPAPMEVAREAGATDRLHEPTGREIRRVTRLGGAQRPMRRHQHGLRQQRHGRRTGQAVRHMATGNRDFRAGESAGGGGILFRR